MSCSQCEAENPPGARFCGACGAPLLLACPSCQTANPPANRFCHHCGASLAPAPADPFGAPRAYTPKHLADKILVSRSALEGERKQVTVLFVDVAGFTSLSERLDPEVVHGLMTRAFELMLREVHRYEGTVNQFLGDGVMALFGAPVAHEDHARRALHAALGIARALETYQAELDPRGIRFRVRQALNTGLVVVGSIGVDLRMDYTAVGDTTNVAARLLQVAEPGQIVMSAATQRVAAGYFHTRDLGSVHVKGKSEPVRAWQVLGAQEARTRLDVEADRGLTPFVGRERELGLLLDLFARVEAGAGQVVFLVGEPGIGKSRLLHELRQRVAERATWLEGHCLSFGRAMAFHPLIDLLRRAFGIGDGDGEAAIAAKVEAAVTPMGQDLAGVAAYVLALLSVDPGDPAVQAMSREQRRADTFDALTRWIARGAEDRAHVVIIEDLHWIDATSEHFLTALVDSVPALRVLLVFTYRPGYVNRFGDRTDYTRIAPTPLSVDEGLRMAADILAAGSLPAELHALIGRKAEGNPFYVEELVRALDETGALRRAGDGRYELTGPLTELSVPETVQDVIAARIDRLDDAPKRLLQLASVIGREFTRRLVGRLSEDGDHTDGLLQHLKAIELIQERRRLPELTYVFKHALTQDVAYGSLLVQRRRELHRRIGLAIEDVHAERLAEHWGVLAHHFVRAEEWDRALPYLLRAAGQAADAYGLREAVVLYGDALRVAERAGPGVSVETVMEIHRTRAELFHGLGEFGLAADEAQKLVELSRRAGDRAREAAALVQEAWATLWIEDFPTARRLLADGVKAAESAGEDRALAGALFVRGFVQGVTAELEPATADLERSVELAHRGGDLAGETLARYFLGAVENWQGSYRRGLGLAVEGVRLAREHRLVIPLIRCLWTEAVCRVGIADYQSALEILHEALPLAEKIEDPAYTTRLMNTLGWLHIECGDVGRGLAISARALALARESRHATGFERVAYTRTNEADAHLLGGDVAAAAEALDEARAIARHPPPSRWMTWRYAMHGAVSLGELALARGDAAAAMAHADESLEIAVPTRSRKYESRAWRLKGDAAMARRAWDDADGFLRRALEVASSIEDPRARWSALAATGRLAQARRDAATAARAYATAAAVVAPVLANVRDAGLRAGLEQLPVIREICDKAPG